MRFPSYLGLLIALHCVHVQASETSTAEAHVQPATDPATRAAAIFEACRARLQLIETVSFEMEFDRPGRSGQWPRHAQVTIADDRFRYEVHATPFGRGGHTTADSLKAFNGVQYQSFDPVDRRLAVSRDPEVRWIGQSPCQTVLWKPFWWLFGQKDLRTWSATKEPERWAQQLQMVRDVREARDGERMLHIVMFENPRGHRWEVDFAPDLGFYPLRSRELAEGAITAQPGEAAGSADVVHSTAVEEWAEFRIDAQTVIVPTLVVRRHGSASDGHVDSRHRVIAGSLRVNQAIEDDRFTTAAADALSVYDLDTGVLSEPGTSNSVYLDADGLPLPPPTANAKKVFHSRPPMFWLLVVQILVSSVLVVALLMLKCRESQR